MYSWTSSVLSLNVRRARSKTDRVSGTDIQESIAASPDGKAALLNCNCGVSAPTSLVCNGLVDRLSYCPKALVLQAILDLLQQACLERSQEASKLVGTLQDVLDLEDLVQMVLGNLCRCCLGHTDDLECHHGSPFLTDVIR